MTLKIALIIAAGIFLIYYRFAFPWTPFWVDVTVMVIACVIAIAQAFSSKAHARTGADSEEQDSP